MQRRGIEGEGCCLVARRQRWIWNRGPDVTVFSPSRPPIRRHHATELRQCGAPWIVSVSHAAEASKHWILDNTLRRSTMCSSGDLPWKVRDAPQLDPDPTTTRATTPQELRATYTFLQLQPEYFTEATKPFDKLYLACLTSSTSYKGPTRTANTALTPHRHIHHVRPRTARRHGLRPRARRTRPQS